MFKNIDWNRVGMYLWHIGLMAGNIALATYAPGAYPTWAPLIQAAAQLSNPVPGVSVAKEPKE